MDINNFIPKSKELVAEYTNSQLDSFELVTYAPDGVTTDHVYVVWFSKTLQNAKALLSTTLPDGMYYEVTYNGDKEEIYFDPYKKVGNKVVDVSEEV